MVCMYYGSQEVKCNIRTIFPLGTNIYFQCISYSMCINAVVSVSVSVYYSCSFINWWYEFQ